jgi:hypothetical protein
MLISANKILGSAKSAAKAIDCEEFFWVTLDT